MRPYFRAFPARRKSEVAAQQYTSTRQVPSHPLPLLMRQELHELESRDLLCQLSMGLDQCRPLVLLQPWRPALPFGAAEFLFESTEHGIVVEPTAMLPGELLELLPHPAVRSRF